MISARPGRGSPDGDRPLPVGDLAGRAGPARPLRRGRAVHSSGSGSGAVRDRLRTSGGALCWPPDIRGWAAVVGRLLEPGRHLYIREAHPVLWALEDERTDRQLVIGLPYFETASPKRWDPMAPGASHLPMPRAAVHGPGRGRLVPAAGTPGAPASDVLDSGLQGSPRRHACGPCPAHDRAARPALPIRRQGRQNGLPASTSTSTRPRPMSCSM
jgi:hypothetical protein